MKVFVYYNLTRKCWSVKSLEGKTKGKVILHAEKIFLKKCEFKVSQKGRERVIRENKKYVHAGVVGYMVNKSSLIKNNEKLATYNPKKYNTFVNTSNLAPIYYAEFVNMEAINMQTPKVYYN